MTNPLFSARPEHDGDPHPFLLAAAAKGKSGDVYFLGNRFDGMAGAEGAVNDSIQQVEFDRVTPVALSFWFDPSVHGADPVGNDQSSNDFVFSTSHSDSDPGSGKLRLSAGLDDSVRLFVNPTGTLLQSFAIAHSNSLRGSLLDGVFPASTRLSLTWQTSGDFNTIEYQPVGVEVVGNYLRFTLSPTNTPGYTTPLANLQQVTLLLTAPKPPPNPAVQARVTYSAGTAGNLTFDCDWAGGLVLHAKRLSVSRVNVPLDPRRRYGDGLISAAVTACPAAPHSPHAPSLTYLPLLVDPTATRLIAIPPLARRVSLLTIYELGDAPLQFFQVAFVTRRDESVAWIDAKSARNALFGEGLPIPPGCTTLALQNRSEDADAQLGAVFHLGV